MVEYYLTGTCELTHSGGCEIGPRPIDLHLKALKSMGAKIEDVQCGCIYCKADKLKGADIHLDYPSVGATENIMLASVFAEGSTYIHNAAKEPEIVDLQGFLQSMGVEVSGAGTGVIYIEGNKSSFKNVEYTVMPDRIVAGTYMIAGGITGGNIVLHNVIPEHLGSIISILKETGCCIVKDNRTLQIIGLGRPRAIDVIRTSPYPGFPTDIQAQMVALLSIAEGTSIVVETVFENRYRYVGELLRMGADIKLEGRLAVIKEVKKLVGANVCAMDLRGGAALVLAGLVAEGETVITGTRHIDRGYENIEEKLAGVGAKIKRIR